jgi:uncharacterized protein YsxB (DUF464 family)
MTTITKTENSITCNGHAGDRICCAMLTALTVSLISNICQRLKETAVYELSDGYFKIDFRNISETSKILIESYWYSLNGLAASYPENFEIVNPGEQG